MFTSTPKQQAPTQSACKKGKTKIYVPQNNEHPKEERDFSLSLVYSVRNSYLCAHKLYNHFINNQKS